MIDKRRNPAKVGFYNDYFNHYVTGLLNTMTTEEKRKLPDDILSKVFRNGKEGSAEGLLLFEIFYLLEIAFNKSVILLVQDNEAGMTFADLKQVKQARKGKVNNSEVFECVKDKGMFVLGGKNLMEDMVYLNNMYTTGIYQLIKTNIPNTDHAKNKKFVEAREAFQKTLAFLKNYEANKGKVAKIYGLTMPEWYALMYFSEERYAYDFYNKDFTYAYNSSRINLFKGMQRIFKLGYLIQKKVGKKDKYILSAKGMDLLNKIFDNILLKPF